MVLAQTSAKADLPIVVIGVTPVYGHVMPMRAVGKELVARGYDVTFVTGAMYKKRIEGIGAKLVGLEGNAGAHEALAERAKVPKGPERFAYDMDEAPGAIDCAA
ncbi:hypothetical protein PWT90_09415 [Aphanocladium album]|nr:hypothetical protein PWT90_09415 [Aphanocladium album]